MPPSTIHFPPFVLDLSNQLLVGPAGEIALRPKAFAVLRYLAEHPGVLVQKAALLDACWPDVAIGDAVLKGCIREIREALGDDANAPRFIKTQSRLGYWFVAEVTTAIGTQRVPDAAPVTTAVKQSPSERPAAAPLLMRDAELSRLRESLAKAQSGTAETVLVTGEAGAGKTALVAAFLAECAAISGVVAGVGNCVEQHGPSESYLPVLAALQDVAARWSHATVSEQLLKHAPSWLLQLPGLASRLSLEDLRREALGAGRERMLREGADVLTALATDVVLILVLEDLHWADAATLEFLTYLGQRRPRCRLLAICTYREGASSSPTGVSRIRALATRKLAGHVALGPLSTDAIRQLLSAQAAGLDLSSTDSLAVAIHKRTGGNPLFATAVVKELTEGLLHATPSATASQQLLMAQVERCIPASIEALTEQAVAALPLDCQQLVEAASVAGYEAAASAVAAALGRSLADVESDLEQLAREHGLLKLAGVHRWANGSACGRYEFAHTLYRDILYRRIAPSRRLQYHLAVARHLAEVTESPPAENAAALAYHFEQGNDFGNAVQALAALAWREAMQLGDRSAVRHLDHALALARQLPASIRVERELDIVEQYAMLASCLGDIPGACEAFERLVRSAEEADLFDWQARGLSGLAGILTWLDPLRAIEFGERAARAANQHADEPLKTQTRGLLGLLRCLFGSTWQPADAEACLAALPAEIGDSDRRKWNWCSRGAHIHALQGDYERSLGVARKGSQFALSQNDMNDYLSMRYQVSGALFFLGRFGDSLTVLSDAMKIAERNADVGWMIMLGVGQACVEAQCFSYASAIERSEQALAFARRSPVRLVPLELMSHALLALSLVGLGRLDDASAAIRNLESVGPRSFNVRLTALIAKLELALAHEQIDAIGEAATALLQLTEPPGEPTGIVWARQALALVAFKQRRWKEADSELTQAQSVLAKKTAPLAAWRLHRAAAEIYEAQSRLDDAKRARTRCAEVLKGIEDSLIGWDSLRQNFIAHPFVAGVTRPELQ